MRFMHTSDWHLGRIFYKQHLTEDQANIMEQIISIAKEMKCEAVLVSGDIYDRSVPPPEAVNLLDETIFSLAKEAGIPVMMITGNHDSADRLSFVSRLLEAENVFIAGAFNHKIMKVTLNDKHGDIDFYLLPYFEPAVIRADFEDEGINTHEDAMRALFDRGCFDFTPRRRSVLLAHAMVQGGQAGDTERPLSIGGIADIGVGQFSKFSYTALGHLHRSQVIGNDLIHYPGSIMKYSFSEAGTQKFVTIVDMEKNGGVRLEKIVLNPPRDLRIIDGMYEQILRDSKVDSSRNDYIIVRLMDKEHVYDAMAKLRRIYPNILHLDRVGMMTEGTSQFTTGDHRKLSPTELFTSFYKDITGSNLKKDHLKVFNKTLSSVISLQEE